MSGSSASRAIAWVLRVLGRALIGALAGAAVVFMVLDVASHRFRIFAFKDPIIGDRSFQIAVGLGAAAFALFAVVFGKAEIRGRIDAAIQGTLTGAMVGIVVGAAFGSAIGSMTGMGMPRKTGPALGIFLFGPLGAIIGGAIGVKTGKRSEKTPSPAIKSGEPENDLR